MYTAQTFNYTSENKVSISTSVVRVLMLNVTADLCLGAVCFPPMVYHLLFNAKFCTTVVFTAFSFHLIFTSFPDSLAFNNQYDGKSEDTREAQQILCLRKQMNTCCCVSKIMY